MKAKCLFILNEYIQISNAAVKLGLNIEVGGTVPMFNVDVNFREQ